jgi:transposase InsO family protein
MWPELIAVPDCTAETTVRALFDNVIARFGLPRGISVLSDNGSAFISKLANLFCKTFGISQFFTSPHHPQPNSRAEAIGDSIYQALKILCSEQTSWSDHLQAVAMAFPLRLQRTLVFHHLK